MLQSVAQLAATIYTLLPNTKSEENSGKPENNQVNFTKKSSKS